MSPGYRVVRLSAVDVRAATRYPYALAESLVGSPPWLVERQPIRPVEAGRSIASSRDVSPLHTDSQMLLSIPAAVQILVCIKRAPRGGESLLVDGDEVTARLERDGPAIADALFTHDRVQRFYFGDVHGPTVSLRGGHLCWTLAPRAEPNDAIGAAITRTVETQARITIPLAEGEALIASNHRMIHGRNAFEGERELVRLLVWLDSPEWSAQRNPARARVVAPALGPEALRRLRGVFALLRGVPPAKVARDLETTEPQLYAWRDTFVRNGLAALT